MILIPFFLQVNCVMRHGVAMLFFVQRFDHTIVEISIRESLYDKKGKGFSRNDRKRLN